MDEEDKSSVEKLALGNHEAFKRLFIKYFPKVNYFIIYLVKSEVIAEELAQDVFLKIWEQRGKMAAVQSFNAYVYRMARNAALNYLEHAYIEDTYLETYRKETSGFSPEDDFYAKEMELLEQLTVSHMPPQRKTVYEMSRKQGLSNEEIACQLNISKKTVENHLNLALKEIRKILSLFMAFFM